MGTLSERMLHAAADLETQGFDYEAGQMEAGVAEIVRLTHALQNIATSGRTKKGMKEIARHTLYPAKDS